MRTYESKPRHFYNLHSLFLLASYNNRIPISKAKMLRINISSAIMLKIGSGGRKFALYPVNVDHMLKACQVAPKVVSSMPIFYACSLT